MFFNVSFYLNEEEKQEFKSVNSLISNKISSDYTIVILIYYWSSFL